MGYINFQRAANFYLEKSPEKLSYDSSKLSCNKKVMLINYLLYSIDKELSIYKEDIMLYRVLHKYFKSRSYDIVSNIINNVNIHLDIAKSEKVASVYLIKGNLEKEFLYPEEDENGNIVVNNNIFSKSTISRRLYSFIKHNYIFKNKNKGYKVKIIYDYQSVYILNLIDSWYERGDSFTYNRYINAYKAYKFSYNKLHSNKNKKENQNKIRNSELEAFIYFMEKTFGFKFIRKLEDFYKSKSDLNKIDEIYTHTILRKNLYSFMKVYISLFKINDPNIRVYMIDDIEDLWDEFFRKRISYDTKLDSEVIFKEPFLEVVNNNENANLNYYVEESYWEKFEHYFENKTYLGIYIIEFQKIINKIIDITNRFISSQVRYTLLNMNLIEGHNCVSKKLNIEEEIDFLYINCVHKKNKYNVRRVVIRKLDIDILLKACNNMNKIKYVKIINIFINYVITLNIAPKSFDDIDFIFKNFRFIINCISKNINRSIFREVKSNKEGGSVYFNFCKNCDEELIEFISSNINKGLKKVYYIVKEEKDYIEFKLDLKDYKNMYNIEIDHKTYFLSIIFIDLLRYGDSNKAKTKENIFKFFKLSLTNLKKSDNYTCNILELLENIKSLESEYYGDIKIENLDVVINIDIFIQLLEALFPVISENDSKSCNFYRGDKIYDFLKENNITISNNYFEGIDKVFNYRFENLDIFNVQSNINDEDNKVSTRFFNKYIKDGIFNKENYPDNYSNWEFFSEFDLGL